MSTVDAADNLGSNTTFARAVAEGRPGPYPIANSRRAARVGAAPVASAAAGGEPAGSRQPRPTPGPTDRPASDRCRADGHLVYEDSDEGIEAARTAGMEVIDVRPVTRRPR
ncbi:hypothetical protein [Streptomyces sp. CB03911]|uniref:hypothetical protein n=1 Tax=Streptomyces sp. CB03911 TaxID=1804758 RepID=UPI00093F33BC|nr:hypothetical protein [Streptomyces sp. CB03911]OKI18470.1 hypothetical protein A6A07_38860 [Streptomyces sp. CB03911]